MVHIVMVVCKVIWEATAWRFVFNGIGLLGMVLCMNREVPPLGRVLVLVASLGMWRYCGSTL